MAFKISTKLRGIGRLVQAVDILIAGMCINRGFMLVTKDKDFTRIREIERNFQLKIIK